MFFPAPVGARLLTTVLTAAGILSAAVPPDPAPASSMLRTVVLSTVRVPAAVTRPGPAVVPRSAARVPCRPAAALRSSWIRQRTHLAAAVLFADSPSFLLWHAARATASTAATTVVSPLLLSCLLPPTAGLRLHPR